MNTPAGPFHPALDLPVFPRWSWIGCYASWNNVSMDWLSSGGSSHFGMYIFDV
jgi:hypothetical protein